MTLHRYTYAGNSPQRFADPSGEFFLAIVLAAVALVGIVSSAAVAAEVSNALTVPQVATVGMTLVLPKNSSAWDSTSVRSTLSEASGLWQAGPIPSVTLTEVTLVEADERYRVIDDTPELNTGNPTLDDIVTDIAQDASTLTFVFADRIIPGSTAGPGQHQCGVAQQPGRAGAVSAESDCKSGRFLAHEVGHNGNLPHVEPAVGGRLMNAAVEVKDLSLIEDEKATWYRYMSDHSRTR